MGMQDVVDALLGRPGAKVQKRGSILPMVKTDEGLGLGWPEMALDAWKAVSLPKAALMDGYQATPEDIGNFALTVGAGGIGASTFAKPKGSGKILGMFSNDGASIPGPKAADAIADGVRRDFPSVDLSLSGGDGRPLVLNKIVVPASERGKGTGTAVMQRLAKEADTRGLTMALDPSGDFGGSPNRLREFYGRFGFTPNKGKGRDFEISQDMYRLPQEPPKEGIRAFHGSPHDFDRFSMDKIGTGEGAQAFGHGLYFAESEGVAKSYRDELSGKEMKWPNERQAAAFDALPKVYRDSLERQIVENKRKPGELRTTVEAMVDGAQRRVGTEFERHDDAALLDAGQRMLAEKGFAKPKPGHMYEVNINANPDDFLDWDKPLSEQSEKVRGAVGSVAPHMAGLNPAHIRGEDAYRGIAGKVAEAAKMPPQEGGGDVARSLREAGVPGLRYLDQGSRTAGDGSRNYVVFDDKLVSILKKYGVLGGLGIPAMGGIYGAGERQ
jgi:GNAT superfamily N-acetyltransferase